ncbi:HNH endonuclease family protein [Bifidobacterium sp. ESL0732]|uniref:HNH endonuclease family protein n=1 Tax=Bifidobacterium sp. ESL0732 TaxID=2983222 RepID=UPI0023F83AED|nr:HNH endonuclease family protein [Bifidobacterium sp. ESL0732]WEV64323.1 HNH endonuclease family protein [Bifidobacterium sp. ESL0732]
MTIWHARGTCRRKSNNYDHRVVQGGKRANSAHFRQRRVNLDSLLVRFLILLMVASLIGIGFGLILPKVSKPFAQMTGQYVATGPVAQVLATLPVDDHPSTRGYDRDSFGYNTTDDDGNGCTIRDDILKRDMTSVRYKAPSACQVKTGALQEPYTGKSIRFVRGKQTSAAVQIDHVVALENAWQSGASKWDAATKQQYGNDAYNLLAVDGPANQQKGSASAAYWLPINRRFRCSYVARQVGVKQKYNLSVTTPEKQAISKVLKTCPAQQIPKE